MVKRNKPTAPAVINIAICGNSENALEDSKAERAPLAEGPDPGEAETWQFYLREDSSVATAFPKPGTFDLNKFKLRLVHVNEWGEIPTCDAMTEEKAYEASEEALRDMEREGLIYDSGERTWSDQIRRYEIAWKAKTSRQRGGRS
jgi:hypothetical protein